MHFAETTFKFKILLLASVLCISGRTGFCQKIRNVSDRPLIISPTERHRLPLEKSKTSEKKDILNPVAEINYTFTGKGNWADPANWQNHLMPPLHLKEGDHVFINGRGACIFSNTQLFILVEGSSLAINEGKELYISIGDHVLLKGGTISNRGKLTVLSGTLYEGLSKKSVIENSGELKNTRMSKITENVKVINDNSGISSKIKMIKVKGS